jgi:hypothetical protein
VTTPPAKAGGFFWKTSFTSGFLHNAWLKRLTLARNGSVRAMNL